MTDAVIPLFDIPAEDPLPPEAVLAPAKLSLTIEGNLNFSPALYGREDEVQRLVDEEGLSRHEAADRIVADYFHNLLWQVSQADGVEAVSLESNVDYTWTEELAAASFAAIVPRYPKRFVGDD